MKRSVRPVSHDQGDKASIEHDRTFFDPLMRFPILTPFRM